MNNETDEFIKVLLKYPPHSVNVHQERFEARYKSRVKVIATLHKIQLDHAIIVVWEEDKKIGYEFAVSEKDSYSERYYAYQAKVSQLIEKMKAEYEIDVQGWRAHEGEEASFTKAIGDQGSLYLQAFINDVKEPIKFGHDEGMFTIGDHEVREIILNNILKRGTEALKIMIKHRQPVSNPLIAETLLHIGGVKDHAETKIDVQVLMDEKLLLGLFPGQRILEVIEKA